MRVQISISKDATEFCFPVDTDTVNSLRVQQEEEEAESKNAYEYLWIEIADTLSKDSPAFLHAVLFQRVLMVLNISTSTHFTHQMMLYLLLDTIDNYADSDKYDCIILHRELYNCMTDSEDFCLLYPGRTELLQEFLESENISIDIGEVKHPSTEERYADRNVLVVCKDERTWFFLARNEMIRTNQKYPPGFNPNQHWKKNRRQMYLPKDPSKFERNGRRQGGRRGHGRQQQYFKRTPWQVLLTAGLAAVGIVWFNAFRQH